MLIRTVLIGAALGGTLTLSAQNPQISLGGEVGIPVGDFGDVASLIVGPSVGFELPVSDQIALTLQAGYQFVMLKSDFDDAFDGWTMIPVQAGLKYFFMEPQIGFYGHAQAGIHSSTVRTPEVDLGIFGTFPATSTSETNFSWALGVGYQMRSLDVALRYNAIMPSGDAPDGTSANSYIGIRLAYLLNIGG